MRVCVCVYAHYTDGVLGCEPRVRDGTPGGPKESRWTKSAYIQSTHVHVYPKRRDKILDLMLFSFSMSFLLRTVEDLTTISKSQLLTSVRI